jgi:protocatechuate 3,4-dioxygenase beta subunit
MWNTTENRCVYDGYGGGGTYSGTTSTTTTSTTSGTSSGSGSSTGTNTTPTTYAPPAPSSLTATLSGTDVVLNWVDVADNENSYELWRVKSDGTQERINSAGANTTSFIVINAFGTYGYFVRVCNSIGCSKSTIVSATVEGGASVSGAVVDTAGAPLPGVSVNLYKAADDAVVKSGHTDAQGKYLISNVLAGFYKIEARPDPSLGLLNSQIITISLTQGQTFVQNFVLQKPSKTISGTVSYSDGSPVANASVNAWKSGTTQGGAQAQTDAGGKYQLQVSGGYWELNVMPKSTGADWAYSGQPKSALFADDGSAENKEVNFIVSRVDASIKGKILKADGQPLAQGSVFVNAKNSSGAWFDGQVDASGAFNISLNSGAYELFVYVKDPAFSAPSIPGFSVGAGEHRDLGTITLVSAVKRIKGSVVREDGSAVANARVGAFNQSDQLWRDAATDSAGNYSLNVAGGSWEVSPEPADKSAGWIYSKPRIKVDFAKDATAEEKVVNFSVTKSDATVKGKILLPDGTSPGQGSLYINLWNDRGANFGGSTDAQGNFEIALVAGTFSLEVSGENKTYGMPPLQPIIVASGQTVDLGAIVLVVKNDHIKGRVRDSAGNGISGVEIGAWQPEGSGHAMTKTGSDGSYDLLVTAGKWEVNAMPDSSKNYYNPKPPARLTVVAGTAAVADFVLYAADAGIEGSVVDVSGNTLADLYGFVELSSGVDVYGTAGSGSIGGPLERGRFSFKAPAGSYSLRLHLPSGSAYSAGAAQSVTLVAGQTTSAVLKVNKNTSVISGSVIKEDGGVVTGIDIHIFATSQGGIWQEAKFDRSTGRYTLNVSAGTWYLGYYLDPTAGFISAREPNIEVRVAEGATAKYDIKIAKADAMIKGRVSDPQGKGVYNAHIAVSKSSFAGEHDLDDFEQARDMFVAGAETDAEGKFTVALPAGQYFVKVFVSPDRGYINSAEQSVAITAGATKTVDFDMRSSDAAITGRVLLDGAPVSGAFVWGWSPDGGY